MLSLVDRGARRAGRGAILALDLGTKTGWCAVREDGDVSSGVFHFPRRPGRHEGDQFLRFQHALISYRKGLIPLDGDPARTLIGRIYFEEVTFGAGRGQTQKAAQLFGAWKGLLLAFAATHGIRVTGIHNATIKKFVTGSGRSGKDGVAWAVRQLGHDPTDDNEADAIALAYLALADEQGLRSP